MSDFIAPGLPGGPPYQAPRRTPGVRGLYLPRTLAERLEADAKRHNPVSQFLRARATMQWGLPTERRDDEASGA